MSNPADITRLKQLLAAHSKAKSRLTRICFSTTDARAIAAAEAMVEEAAAALAAYGIEADSARPDA